MNKRIRYIDFFRGLAIINMVIYHALYDLKYIFLADISFTVDSYYMYQQYIAISFIFLSGLSSNYSSKLLKNGIKLFFISMGVTITTSFISKDLVIYFGILHFLSVGMILIWIFEYFKRDKVYTEKKYTLLFLLMMVCFIGFKNLLNIDAFYMFFYRLFENIDHSFMIGFPSPDFSSGDYFPLIPWIFLMFSGYFFSGSRFNETINAMFNNIGIFEKLNIIEVIGRYSLIIYILHQIILYGILSLIF